MHLVLGLDGPTFRQRRRQPRSAIADTRIGVTVRSPNSARSSPLGPSSVRKGNTGHQTLTAFAATGLTP